MNNNDILNKYIDLIDKGYCCACNELNCIDNFPQAKITHAIRKLQQENKQLKEKLDKYENPEDMTLMMMWCTEKVKDENKQLKKQLEESKNLKNKLLVYNASIKGNWNKLKGFIVNEIPEEEFVNNEYYVSILDKMVELERDVSDE